MSNYFVFDAYGTLLKVSSTIAGLSAEQEALSEKIQDLWRSKQLQYTWLSSMMGTFEGFNKITIDALDYAFSYYKVEDSALKEKVLSIFDRPTAFGDANDFLRACKTSGYRTAILSNGEPEKLKQSAQIAGIDNYLDHIFSASEVEIFKPSPKVYQLPVEAYQCRPQDIFFFSSNPWDVAGATKFGYRTIWINRNNLPFEQLGVNPTRSFKSLDAVVVDELISG